MILVPDRFCYVLNPRTGSRAMERAFLDQVPGAQKIGRHHGYVDGYGLPVYATIRSPADLVLSHWWKAQDRLTLAEYIKQRTPRLNVHHGVIDRYFLYDDGLEQIFADLGYPGVKTERIGGSNPDRTYLTPARVHLINRAFPEDNDLYLNALRHRHDRENQGRGSEAATRGREKATLPEEVSPD